MNGSTTRARRSSADKRRDPRSQAYPHRDQQRGEPIRYIDGANALDIGYLDAPEELAPRKRSGSPAESSRPAQPRRGSLAAPQQPPPRAAQQAHELTQPHKPPLPVALPRASFLIAMVSLVVVGVLGVLVINTKINENAFRLDDLQAQRAALDLQEQQLAQELAERESPGNLRAAAKRLGLVPAGSPAFINLPDGRVVGVPQPAGAQQSGVTSTTEPGR